MSVSLNTEIENEQSNLFDSLSSEFEMFEIIFVFKVNNENVRSIKVHSHIIFPKCKKLSTCEKDEEGNYIIPSVFEIFDVFKIFLKLLYGKTLTLSFYELYDLCFYLNKYGYHKIAEIRKIFIDNINKIPHNDENEMKIIKKLLDDNEYFINETILNKCTLSQLKKLKDTIDNVDLLRMIIDIILKRYSTDTKEIKAFGEKKLLENIGKYETRIRRLNDEIDASIQKTPSNSKNGFDAFANNIY